MLSTLPSPVAPAPSQFQPAAVQQATPIGAVPSAGPRTEMGSAAVTQVQTIAKAGLDMADPTDAVPEIPPDPPPLKGLGIPPLNMTMVGDGDEVQDVPPPPAQSRSKDDYVSALQPPALNGVDKRV